MVINEKRNKSVVWTSRKHVNISSRLTGEIERTIDVVTTLVREDWTIAIQDPWWMFWKDRKIRTESGTDWKIVQIRPRVNWSTSYKISCNDSIDLARSELLEKYGETNYTLILTDGE